jgi:hypothetical protein
MDAGLVRLYPHPMGAGAIGTPAPLAVAGRRVCGSACPRVQARTLQSACVGWLRWNRHGRGARNTTAPSELGSKVHVMARPSFDFRA